MIPRIQMRRIVIAGDLALARDLSRKHARILLQIRDEIDPRDIENPPGKIRDGYV